MVFRKKQKPEEDSPETKRKIIEQIEIDLAAAKASKAELERIESDDPEVKSEESSSSEIWKVESVATQTEPVIYNTKTSQPYTVIQALVELLNRTE